MPDPTTRASIIVPTPIRCVHCATRAKLHHGVTMHGGWIRCTQCRRYTYVLPFVGLQLVLLVEITAQDITELSARGASPRTVLEYLGVARSAA